MENRRLKLCVKAAIMAIAALSLLTACGSNDVGAAPSGSDKEITVMLLDGEHYSVSGAHKTTVLIGEDAEFVVELERGYRISGAFGDECEYTENVSFTQTVVFTDIKYKSTVQLETEAMETAPFSVSSNGGGSVSVNSCLGEASDGVYYTDDKIELSVEAEEGYRFKCWSTGNYLTAGGAFYSYDRQLVSTETDFIGEGKLYANFSGTDSYSYTIIYDMCDGSEIEQDCYSMIEHHARANTLTAKNLADGEYFFGSYDFDDGEKMLVGWETDEGEYVGLGSRIEVSATGYITLYAVWKEYSDEAKFTVENGVITSYTDDGGSEVVIPKEIEGEEVTGIAAEAFAGSGASVYYIPDSVTSVAENAFHGCTSLTDLYMSDNIMTISDSSFTGCKNFTTLHLNAYLKPRYSTGTNYNNIQAALKGEVFDLLIKNYDSSTPKLVILGGSSVLYGYNSALSQKLLYEETDIEYEIYNLGYNMHMCGVAFAAIITEYLKKGDIFLHAPEAGGTVWSAGSEISLINEASALSFYSGLVPSSDVFGVFESDWQQLSLLPVNLYSNLFDKFKEFNDTRFGLAELSYSDYCTVYDAEEDGREELMGEYTFYKYGDLVIAQTNNDNISWGATSLTTVDYAIQNADKYIYSPLYAKGIRVYVTFSPVNYNDLHLYYGSNLAEKVNQYTQQVQNLLADSDVTVLLSKSDTVYNGGSFSNSQHHLGYPARDTHTTKVINALISALKGE